MNTTASIALEALIDSHRAYQEMEVDLRIALILMRKHASLCANILEIVFFVGVFCFIPS